MVKIDFGKAVKGVIMSIFDYFKRKKQVRKCRENTPGSSKKEQSPVEYNTKLLEKLYEDLKNDNLPDIQDSTMEEIEKYKREKRERSNHLISPNVDEEKMQSNLSIPAEVDMWVDKIFEYYLGDWKPMLGGVHPCNGARKALYRYKGYNWYSISELYPTVIFD